MVDELQPDGLPDVLSIGAAQPVAAADGPDERSVPLDEGIPRLLVAIAGARHQISDHHLSSHRTETLEALSGWAAARISWRSWLGVPPLTGVVSVLWILVFSSSRGPVRHQLAVKETRYPENCSL